MRPVRLPTRGFENAAQMFEHSVHGLPNGRGIIKMTMPHDTETEIVSQCVGNVGHGYTTILYFSARIALSVSITELRSYCFSPSESSS